MLTFIFSMNQSPTSEVTQNLYQAYTVLEELKELVPQDNIDRMKFLMLEEKYLELLMASHEVEALKCLRTELSPFNFEECKQHLYRMTQCLMYDADKLQEKIHWRGKTASRQKLLDKLQEFLPANVMLPPSRLLTLLHQAAEQQRKKCLFHNTAVDNDPNSIGYLTDHKCSLENFPCMTTTCLTDHTDEVWFCAFSPNGENLATGSKDGNVFIYSVNLETHEIRLKHKFDKHSMGVAYMSWSPDSSYLIVCGPETCHVVWIYDIDDGKLHKKWNRSIDDSLTCAAWHGNSQQFYLGGARGQFLLCDLEGEVVKSWEGVRVQDLCDRSSEGSVLIVDTHYRIKEYDHDAAESEKVLVQEEHPVMSFTIDQTETLALLNVASQGVHLWDLKKGALLRKFQGMTHGYFVTHSSFGGANEDFVAAGSEEPSVYIYHKSHDKPVLKLKGHTSIVNCVHWNPSMPSMLASASDDGSVRIWGPKSKVRLSEDGELGSSIPV
ncbi:WD repeat-containing protein 26-like isoform X2 [Babylonia areolata]|uniref:WD repeat-containing protein 26-like isoform X2 n=1 Tax=Babylonia areolata TaxID=304850 RepID=UPI003FCEF9E7